MKKYLFVLSALVLFAFSSCQKIAGDPITKVFSIDGSYTELEVQDAFNVTVSDTATWINITVGENVMPNVVVERVENKLKIYLQPAINISGSNEMKVILPYNANLKSVDLSGESEFHSVYGLYGPKIEVELSGASDFYCGIEADEVDMDLSGRSHVEGYVNASELDLDMSGASDATLRGQVTTLDIDLSGASNIVKKVVENCYALACDECEGMISGASEAYIHCDGRICVNLSGASHLHYTGDGISSGCSTTTGGSTISGPEHP